MLQFMERNGYDVSYFGSLDTDRRGALIKNHKVFTSTGHDEYWSGAQRANVESARDAGVNLAFFSGNEVYWRTRWEPSIDGTSTAGPHARLLQGNLGQRQDRPPTPSRLPRGVTPVLAPPPGRWAARERPDRHAVHVQLHRPRHHSLRARGQAAALAQHHPGSLAAGQTTALAPHTIGYESDEDLDNGSRPQGLVRLSTTTGRHPRSTSRTTAATSSPDYHSPPDSLPCPQRSPGLRSRHGPVGVGSVARTTTATAPPADVRMQQATVNLLPTWAPPPSTIMPGLTASTADDRHPGPTTTITSPTERSRGQRRRVTVTGTASDAGGKVAGVEVSTDGGTTGTRRPARPVDLPWVASGRGSSAIKARAIDDSANIGAAARCITVSCPCSLFGDRVPTTPAADDTSGVEVGVRFVPAETATSPASASTRAPGTPAPTPARYGPRRAPCSPPVCSVARRPPDGRPSSSRRRCRSMPPPPTLPATTRPTDGMPRTHSSSRRRTGTPPLSAKGKLSGESNGVYLDGAGFPNSSFGDTNYWVDVQFSVDDTTRRWSPPSRRCPEPPVWHPASNPR